jgi:iron complex outermembrane receptor protein
MGRGSLLLLFTSSLLAPELVCAQVGGIPTTGANPPSDVAEVMVTAQRRTERLLDVPVSVTVVGGAAARAAGVVSTRDLAQVAPGFVAGQTGFAFQPSVRGISSTGTGAGDEANVATYIDNVYVAANAVTAFNLGDIDRIEILKGPQGTLFGRNATGGAVRVVTGEPSFVSQFNGAASAGFTLPESRELSAYGSSAITEKWAGSLAGYYYDDDGYLTNADPNYSGKRQGSLNGYVLRGKLLYKPTDRLKIVAETDYGQSVSGVELNTVFLNNVSVYKNVVGVIPALAKDQVSTNEKNPDKTLSDGAYANIEYTSEKFIANSISAVRQVDLSISFDSDRTNLPISRTVQKNIVYTYSQELNIASNFSAPLNFIAGAYFYYENAKNPYASTFSARFGPVVGGVRAIAKPLSAASAISDDLRTTSYSGFGEATYEFDDRLSLVGGTRYSIDYKTAESTNLLVPGSPTDTTANHWDNVSYRVTAQYKPASNALLYFTNSTGFKSGNINAPSYPYPAHQDQVLPETVTAYELGYKARLLPHLDMSTSAFHYDYSDIQLTTNNALAANAGVVGISVLQNAARAEIAGADFELNGRLDSHWGGELGLSWLPTADYTRFKHGLHYVPAPNELGAVTTVSDLSGSRILRAPVATLNAGINYQTDVAGGKLLISTNYFRTTKTYLAIGQVIQQPDYNILAAEVGWRDPSGQYTISTWGRNLTNETYFISGNVNSGGFAAVWAKPREVGARIRVQY